MPEHRKLRVFLCHASQDKPVVRELYERLCAEGWIDPWLDEEKLLPGQDWDLEIEKAVEAAEAVIVCLSTKSVTKEGYVQRELKFALDIALEKPDGTIFIIPLRLDDCVPPRRLRVWQYVDYFPVNTRQRSYARLIQSLQVRSGGFSLQEESNHVTTYHQDPTPAYINPPSNVIPARIKKEKRISIALVLGTVGFFIPIVGLLLGMVSIVIGFFELKSNVRTQAVIGIVISVIGACLWLFLWYIDANNLWCNFLPMIEGC